MYHLAAQCILAARGTDDENPWVQILVFILFAVIYAIGGIIKARSAKQQQKKAEMPPPRPRPRPQAPPVAGAPQAVRPRIPRTAVSQPAPTITTRPEARIPTPSVAATEPEKPVRAFPELQEPDALRRAILYYEILGKPVSLRQLDDPLTGR